jgi:hypothetical protein
LLKQQAEAATRAAAAAKARAATEATNSKSPWDPEAEGKALLARHPELKPVVVEGTDAVTRFTYGGAYAKLNLTPAQIARLEELMRESSSLSVPVNGQPAVIKPGTGMTGKEVDDALTALLGEEKKRQLREYGLAAPDRQLTASVASALCFTDSPLSPAQAEELARIFTTNRAKPQSWGVGELDWTAAVVKARSLLSAPQLAVLEGLRAQAAEQALIYSPVK